MQAAVRQPFKYQLMPTPEQKQALETVWSRCRTLDNAAWEQRTTWWGRGQGISATYYQQKVELPDLKATCPDYAEVHSPVLHDVLVRVERTYQAFFRRIQQGETPGYPRFQGKDRSPSFPSPQYGNGAVLDGGVLSRSKMGRIPLRLHRPPQGTPKTVTIGKEADGGYAACACAEVPAQPLPPTGRETGIDVGLKGFLLKGFLLTAEGAAVENPRHYPRAERRLAQAQQRVSRRKQGSRRRDTARTVLAKKHQQVRRPRHDFHHQTALALLRQYDTL